jgi:hypothetical protein
MFKTMQEVREANAAAGMFWFSPDTMRFFRCRVGSELFTRGARQFFVSSEQFSSDHPRLYTIREVKANGDIDTLGEFQQFKTSAAARRAIMKITA